MAKKRKKKAKRTKRKLTKKRKKRSPTREKQKKVIFIVVDGLADTPQNGKTPLSKAKKPNIDWFAANGSMGELRLVPKGFPVASHVANVSLLGYDPKRYQFKRGPLEAVGADIPYKEGHLALRCNFATVDKDLIVTDRRAGRSSYGLDEIARYINRNVKIPARFIFIRTYGHRAALIIKGRLSDKISGNDSYKASGRVGIVTALGPNERTQRSAELVQSFVDRAHNLIEYHVKNSERIERGLPAANYLLVRGAGNTLQALPNFPKKWKIDKAVCISENGVMKATCLLAGFNAITVPEFPTKKGTDMEKTLDFIFDNIDAALAEHDFVYIHIKHADEAAHDGDFGRKQRTIEEIDKRLEPFKSFDGVLVLTCDHITSTDHQAHMPGNVPVLVYGHGKDRVRKFSEFSAKRGSLGTMKGRQLLKYIFSK